MHFFGIDALIFKQELHLLTSDIQLGNINLKHARNNQIMINILLDISKNAHTKVDSYLVYNVCNLYHFHVIRK